MNYFFKYYLSSKLNILYISIISILLLFFSIYSKNYNYSLSWYFLSTPLGLLYNFFFGDKYLLNYLFFHENYGTFDPLILTLSLLMITIGVLYIFFIRRKWDLY